MATARCSTPKSQNPKGLKAQEPKTLLTQSVEDKTKAFGIDSANVFGFWDWVGAVTALGGAVWGQGLPLEFRG